MHDTRTDKQLRADNLVETRETIRELIITSATDAAQPARTGGTLSLPFEPPPRTPDPLPLRLLVAGPRESKWRGAQEETMALLHR